MTLVADNGVDVDILPGNVEPDCEVVLLGKLLLHQAADMVRQPLFLEKVKHKSSLFVCY